MFGFVRNFLPVNILFFLKMLRFFYRVKFDLFDLNFTEYIILVDLPVGWSLGRHIWGIDV